MSYTTEIAVCDFSGTSITQPNALSEKEKKKLHKQSPLYLFFYAYLYLKGAISTFWKGIDR